MKKTILAILALTALVFAQTSFAAGLGPRYITEDMTLGSNNVAASGTLTINQAVDLRKVSDVAVQVYLKQTGSGTDNHTLTVEKSLDGSNWGTIAGGKWSIVVPGNGTTAVVAVTNLTETAARPLGWIRLATLVNGDSGDDLTNVAIKVSYKMDTP